MNSLRRSTPSAYLFTTCLLLTALLFTSCAIRLTPAYNRQIISGLNNANIGAMTLFVSLSDGARKSQSARYRDQYDELIGILNALEMLILIRPTPERPSGLVAAVLGNPTLDLAGEPPVEPIQGMARIVEQIRDQHAATGLTATEIEGMEKMWRVYMDQALTFEASLIKRR